MVRFLQLSLLMLIFISLISCSVVRERRWVARRTVVYGGGGGYPPPGYGPAVPAYSRTVVRGFGPAGFSRTVVRGFG